MYKRLKYCLKSNRIIITSQDGFIESKSTYITLQSFITEVTDNIDKRNFLLVYFATRRLSSALRIKFYLTNYIVLGLEVLRIIDLSHLCQLLKFYVKILPQASPIKNDLYKKYKLCKCASMLYPRTLSVFNIY